MIVQKKGWQFLMCYGVVVFKVDLGPPNRVGIVANLHTVAFQVIINLVFSYFVITVSGFSICQGVGGGGAGLGHSMGIEGEPIIWSLIFSEGLALTHYISKLI